MLYPSLGPSFKEGLGELARLTPRRDTSVAIFLVDPPHIVP